MGKKDGEPDPALKVQTVIQCARVASKLAELRSFPGRITAPPAADRPESEDLRNHAADLKAKLVVERAKRRRLEGLVGQEVMLHVALLAITLCFSLFLLLI